MEVLDRLIDAGFRVRAQGNRLTVAPTSLLTEETRALVARSKDRLLAELLAIQTALCEAVNRACAARGDDEANRLALLSECCSLDVRQQLDLIEHFLEEAKLWERATGRRQ